MRASALGPVRDSVAEPTASFDRTAHGQVDLERELGERLRALVTAGASGARLVGGDAYLDVYGLVGVSWSFAPR